MDKRAEAIALLVMTGLLLLPIQAAGDIYQYEDDKGTVHFVDDPGKIPPKYQKRQRTRDVDMGGSDGHVTRVTISGNRVLVPVTLCYRGKEEKAQFVLDTGASSSTISPRLAKMLNFDLEGTRRGYARGVGGGVYAVRQVMLDYLAVGPNRKYDVGVVVIESTQADGLLGMDFLRERRYHVDFHESTITWGN
jgi:predicted aspartyl protease